MKKAQVSVNFVHKAHTLTKPTKLCARIVNQEKVLKMLEVRAAKIVQQEEQALLVQIVYQVSTETMVHPIGLIVKIVYQGNIS